MFKTKEVIELTDIFDKYNHKLFIVGGAVRDYYLGKESKDIDFATDATPEQVIKMFETENISLNEEKFKVIPTGIKYGTVTIHLNGKNFEVTTFRSDDNYRDFRHPEKVKYSKSLEEDLSRRDFTFNAMAFNPIQMVIIDFYDGAEDLDLKTIRCVGIPHRRFKEDALRMLRACRFSAQLGFCIEKETLEAIRKNAHLIRNVSDERVRDELLKLLEGEYAYFGLEYMFKTGLMKFISPELNWLGDVNQPKKHHRYNVLYHSFQTVEFLPKKGLLRLAGLFHDVGKITVKKTSPYFPNHEKLGLDIWEKVTSKRFKLSNEEIDYVSFLIENHMLQFQLHKWTSKSTNRWLSKQLNRKPFTVEYISKQLNRKYFTMEYIDDLINLFYADKYATGKEKSKDSLINTYISMFKITIDELIEKQKAGIGVLTVKDLKVNGYDLINVGIPSSPLMGMILNKLLDVVIEDKTKNVKETLLKLAVTLFLENK